MKIKDNKQIKGMTAIVGEFKEFISRGNVMDMAVGIIIGAAFTAIVTSLVTDMVMPLIGLLFGGIDFSGLSFTIKDATIYYGKFIQAVINFFLVALSVFVIIKQLNRLKKKKEVVKKPVEPVIDPQIAILTEIRDLLRNNK